MCKLYIKLYIISIKSISFLYNSKTYFYWIFRINLPELFIKILRKKIFNDQNNDYVTQKDRRHFVGR